MDWATATVLIVAILMLGAVYAWREHRDSQSTDTEAIGFVHFDEPGDE